MKVKIQMIPESEEERAELLVHKKDSSIERLADYIEMEAYHSVVILCGNGDDIYRVPCTDIYYIETGYDKRLVHVENAVFVSEMRLYELENILPPCFIRISKSAILNINKVASYKPLLNGMMSVKLVNGEVTYISRKYLKEVRNRIMEVRYEEK